MTNQNSTTRTALIVAHEPDGPGGQVAVRLAERGLDVTTHYVTKDSAIPNEATPWPDFADYDVVALMGSIRSLTNKEEIDTWIFEELDLVRSAAERGQPVLGVCFGAQVIADALGGSVELAPVTEIGWTNIEAAPGANNPAGPGPWMEWHHDRCIAPPDATVLAENENAVQVFSIGNMVATQFHPEVDIEHITEWLRGAPPEYLAEHGQNAEDLIEQMTQNEVRNTQQCHSFVDWFLDEVAFPQLRASEIAS